MSRRAVDRDRTDAAARPGLSGVVLLNPRSGGEEWDAAAVGDVLSPLGDLEVTVTTGPEHARREAERATARGVDLVIAGGGDGTVNHVINGIADGGGRACLGVLPLGTANDFARSLGLPLDPGEAADTILAGVRRRIDLVSVAAPRRQLFVNVAAGGLGPPDEGEDAAKSALGRLAYFLDAVGEMSGKAPHDITMDWDGGRVEGEVLAAVVANGRLSGGNVPVAPQALFDDGLVDVILIPAVGLGRLTALAPRILTGQHLRSDDIVVRRTREVRIRSRPPMRFRLDGEDAGEGYFRARALPSALEVAAPAGPSRRRRELRASG